MLRGIESSKSERVRKGFLFYCAVVVLLEALTVAVLEVDEVVAGAAVVVDEVVVDEVVVDGVDVVVVVVDGAVLVVVVVALVAEVSVLVDGVVVVVVVAVVVVAALPVVTEPASATLPDDVAAVAGSLLTLNVEVELVAGWLTVRLPEADEVSVVGELAVVADVGLVVVELVPVVAGAVLVEVVVAGTAVAVVSVLVEALAVEVVCEVVAVEGAVCAGTTGVAGTTGAFVAPTAAPATAALLSKVRYTLAFPIPPLTDESTASSAIPITGMLASAPGIYLRA